MGDRVITLTQASEQTGLSKSTLTKYCARGLIGKKHPTVGFWLMTQDEVDWIAKPENRPKNGRPKNEEEPANAASA